MANYAIIVRHKIRPERRAAIEAVWKRHMAPAIEANPGHLAYHYGYDPAAETICAYQLYTDQSAADDFIECQAYQTYLVEVGELLDQPPVVTPLEVIWSKSK